MQIDPRQYSRFSYRTNAVLILLPRVYEVTLIDISLHGVLVGLSVNAEIGAGDHARLRVLTEKGNQACEVETRVAHRSEQLIGLEINSIDHHAKNTLHRLIEMNLGTLDLASRTLPILLQENCVLSRGLSAGRTHARNGADAPQRVHA